MAGDTSSGSASAAAAASLRDEALAAAKKLEDEAASLRSSNTERSSQLHEEAELLKSAAAAQERVRLAAAALEAERAQADALEQQASALRERIRAEALRDDAPSDDDVDSVASEAEAIARLHSQAAALQNIKNLVPIVLDLQASNYSKWRGYLLLVLGRFALKDHVLSDANRPHDAAWSRMDCVVVSWIFNTISSDLLDVIHERDGVTARAAWLGLEQQFFNNHESCAILLDAEFRQLCQGALSDDEFCRKMKGMADCLADLGEPVQDRTLVLNVLRGLNERFQFMTQLISRQKPFPSFNDVRADLRLAELNMNSASAPPAALVASTNTKPPTLSAPSAPPPPWPQQPTNGQFGGHGQGSGNGRNRRRRGGRGQGGPQGSSGGPPSGQQWPSFLNPWTGSIHMWPGSTLGGQRGSAPRVAPPSAPPQQALMAGTSPGFHAPLGAFHQAPHMAPLLPGRHHHGPRSRSPTRSAPSPLPLRRAPPTGSSTPVPPLTLPPTLVWLPLHLPPLFPPPLL